MHIKTKTIITIVIIGVLALFSTMTVSCSEGGAPPANYEELEFEYCSSTGSNKYHLKSCYWAKKIYERNLVMYQSQEDAISSGKISCKKCRP